MPRRNAMPSRVPALDQLIRHALYLLALGATSIGIGHAQPAPETWTVAGRQGMILQVIVPLEQAKDRDAYRQQIEILCQGKETCFVNFYTNSAGAPLAIPLPDAISHEATATQRRSAKRGSEVFRWSCRLALPEPDCF
jgi:hypothetical protein